MPHSDLSSLKKRISSVAKKSPLARHLKDVVVEAGEGEDGSNFLRVLIELDSLSGVPDDQMQDLTSSIETAVDAMDERFPSVRFSEAA